MVALLCRVLVWWLLTIDVEGVVIIVASIRLLTLLAVAVGGVVAVGSFRLLVGLLRVLLRWLLLLNVPLLLLWLVVVWLWSRLAVGLLSRDLQVLRFVL